MRKIIGLLLILFGLSSASCSNEDKDTIRPSIEIISPDNNNHFTTGTSIKLVVEFADNDALSSYKIDIHNNADGHGSHGNHKHSNIEARHEEHDDHDHTYFSYKKIGNLPSNTTAKIEVEIPIPESVNGKHIEGGEYHLLVFVTDLSSNENIAYRTIFVDEAEEY